MNKEEVLQRANDYCNERSYDKETLTDEFKDKFAEFFAKRHESAGIDDEGILDEIKFNLDTAKSAAAKGITLKQTGFNSKESEYKNKIAELESKLKDPKSQQQQQQQFELPDEVKNKLAEWEAFKDEKSKQDKRKSILELAKKNVRENLHGSFEKFAENFEVSLDKEDKEQAETLVSKYQSVMQSTLGDIKPLAPRQVQHRDEEAMASIPVVKVC